MTRPPAALVAQWYRRLGSSNIERPDGTLRAEQPGGRMLSLTRAGAPPAADHSRRMASWEHDACAAAVWRFPLKRHRPPARGRRGVTVSKQRRVLALLAEGQTHRQIVARVHVSFSVVARLARAVREWKDPDDDD